jgi:hypothetical protein
VRVDNAGTFDSTRPNIARVWDYWLGGKDNFAADRELGDKLLAIHPVSAQMARENRAFLRRAVRYVAARGVGQFLDVGAGLPTALNTHEIAQEVDRTRASATSTTTRWWSRTAAPCSPAAPASSWCPATSAIRAPSSPTPT